MTRKPRTRNLPFVIITILSYKGETPGVTLNCKELSQSVVSIYDGGSPECRGDRSRRVRLHVVKVSHRVDVRRAICYQA